MYKLVAYLLILVLYMLLNALQTDEEMSLKALFQAKHALNRAAHAAAQQLDISKLSAGIYSIEPFHAETTAMSYLQRNLRLDASNHPLPGTFFKQQIEILAFEVINEDRGFPYIYENASCGYKVTLARPGVILIIRVEYPRMFNIMGPVTWEIKGTAELYEA